MARKDKEMESYAAKLSKQKQKLQDQNRIQRKVFRKATRAENALVEYEEQLVKVFKKNNLSELTIKHRMDVRGAIAVVQLSDIHFNELVDTKGNQYNFQVASQRLAKFADKVKMYLSPMRVRTVLVAMTGDMMNSDRRIDELLSQSTNRAMATFVAIDLLQQFLLDLNKNFNVVVSYVTGNESRLGQEVAWTGRAASDNFDTMIFNGLRLLFDGSKGVTFVDSDPVEEIVQLGGFNLLMIHGNGAVKKNNPEKDVQQVIGRYAAKGIEIHYVILGHLHSAYIGDYFGRSSSLVGENAYSDASLNLMSKASQNLYIFNPDGGIDGLKIDLQNVEEQPGYKVKEHLVAYSDEATKLSPTNRDKFQIKF